MEQVDYCMPLKILFSSFTQAFSLKILVYKDNTSYLPQYPDQHYILLICSKTLVNMSDMNNRYQSYVCKL